MNYRDNFEILIMEAFTAVKTDKEIAMPNIEDECALILARRASQRAARVRKIAAIAAVVVTFSCVAVAAFVKYGLWAKVSADRAQIIANEPESVVPSNASSVVNVDTIHVLPHVIAFDDAALSEIMDSLRVVYAVEVNFANEEVRHIHLHFSFNSDDELLDVVQSLNVFDKISIIFEDGKLEVK